MPIEGALTSQSSMKCHVTMDSGDGIASWEQQKQECQTNVSDDNTVLPGWLNDNYPSMGDGKISWRICFFQLPYYCCRFILVHIVTLHRILFNLFVLTVNLNSYCSSKDREVRANRLYCVWLTSVNYGHCGFRARWSRINFDRYIPTRIVSICSKISQGQSKFSD